MSPVFQSRKAFLQLSLGGYKMVHEKRSNVERKKNISLAIDASRNRSGGAIAHLKGILAYSNPREFGITHIHLWSYKKLLDDIPDKDWLTKHSHPSIEKSISAWLICASFNLYVVFSSAKNKFSFISS